MSILRTLLEEETESVFMSEDDLSDLLEEATEEIKGNSEEDDPIVGYDITRVREDKFVFSYTYNGWQYEEINIRIRKE